MSNWPHVIRSRLRGAGMFSVGLALLGVVLLFNVAKLGLLLWAASVAAVGTYVAYWAGRTIIRRRMSTATPDERPALMIARALIAIGVLVAMAIVAGCSAQASTVPMDWRMRASLKSALKDAWGLRGSDYMSLSAAQIQQESGWRPDAVSKYAIGLAQFTPATADWIANRYRDMLWPADPSRPAWSITAMTLYDRDLYKPLSWARNSCDRWAFALSAYNGGPAWINRDRAECKKHSGCDDRRWFGEVEKYSARSTSAAHENRHYVSRVLHVLTPQYTAAGYGGVAICEV